MILRQSILDLDQMVMDHHHIFKFILMKLVQGASALSSILSFGLIRIDKIRSTKLCHYFEFDVSHKIPTGNGVYFYTRRRPL